MSFCLLDFFFLFFSFLRRQVVVSRLAPLPLEPKINDDRGIRGYEAQGHYVVNTSSIHHFGFAFTKNIFLSRLVTTVHRINVSRFFFFFQEINYFRDSCHQNSTITENLHHLICFTGGAFKLFHIQNGPKSELAIESTQQEKRETEPLQGYCSVAW